MGCVTGCWTRSWPVVLIYGEILFLFPTGLQLLVRDAQVVPEELFFQLQKSPQHGMLVKYTAKSSVTMAAGSHFLCTWPAWGISFFSFFL
jgi:hypothetical protein